MRIDLALQHFVLVLTLLILIADPLIHQCFHIFGEIVDASADVAELMLPLDRGVALENSLGNVLHSDLQFLYRMIDHMIKNRVKNDTGNDGARHDDENDGCKLPVKRIDRDQLRDIAVFRGERNRDGDELSVGI